MEKNERRHLRVQKKRFIESCATFLHHLQTRCTIYACIYNEMCVWERVAKRSSSKRISRACFISKSKIVHTSCTFYFLNCLLFSRYVVNNCFVIYIFKARFCTVPYIHFARNYFLVFLLITYIPKELHNTLSAIIFDHTIRLFFYNFHAELA